MNRWIVYQSCDRFATPAVSAWLATHGIDACRRFLGEERALTKVCEQVAGISGDTRLDPGEPTTRRSKNGSITVRYDALHVTFVVRRI